MKFHENTSSESRVVPPLFAILLLPVHTSCSLYGLTVCRVTYPVVNMLSPALSYCHSFSPPPQKYKHHKIHTILVAVRSKPVAVRSLYSRYCGFESCWGHRYSSRVFFCAGSCPCDGLITRTEESLKREARVCVHVCNLETSTIKRPGPDLGPLRHRKVKGNLKLIQLRSMLI